MSLTPHSPPAVQEKLSGAIERLTFHSTETGFFVARLRVKGKRDTITVIGSAASISPGEYLECIGNWNNDRQHGLQFKAQFVKVVPPNTLDGIEKYLSSGMVKGIGAHFAKKLVRAFGEDVFDVIEQDPQRLLSLEGIGKKRQQQVVEGWNEQKAIREIMVFLQSYGIGTTRAVRIFKTYGDESIQKVRENPYRLALDIHGIGFKTADTLAQQLGIPKDSILRARAGVCHVLQEQSSQGHCAAEYQQLLDAAHELLEIEIPTLQQAIADEVATEHLIVEFHSEQKIVFLSSLHKAESGCATQLSRIAIGAIPWKLDDPVAALKQAEQHTGLSLSESQQSAVQTILQCKTAVMTGGPGVGKTTIIKSILSILDELKVQSMLCAPTGRAAKRLSESTGKEAKTVHRLLAFDPTSFGFKHNESNPLDTQLLVVDEASMLDISLINQLLKAIPNHAALLLVGDTDQLPSVGPGSVLADIIKSGCIKTVQLNEIFRQAASSNIIINAHRINAGQMPQQAADDESDFYLIPASSAEDIYNKLMHVVCKRIPERFAFNPITEIQVLTAMNRGGVGVRALNSELQQQLNGNTRQQITRFGVNFAPEDKVIQMVNNYDKDVYNGDIGFIDHIDTEENLVYIEFDGRQVEYEMNELDEIQLAYAVSIHKSQGSEYPVIVIPLAMQHYMLLERNLIYTAITRGKELVVVIAEKKALAMAVHNQKARKRLTTLSQRLQSQMAFL